MRNVMYRASLAACLCLLTAGVAEAGEWEFLGERVVNWRGEKDTIAVGKTGIYKKLKFKVVDNGVEILDLKVHFGNGNVHDVQVRQRIQPGGETRAIDLPGEGRVIKKIVMTYRTKQKGLRVKKAKVRAFGKTAGPGGAAQPEPANKPVWVKLGAKQVSFTADKDVIPVTAASGTFRKIKLKVTGNAINMLDLKVHFGNGDVQDVQVRKNIPEGGETRVIDLPGAVRVIKKIALTYKTKLRRALGGKAQVHVFGLQETGGPAQPKPAEPKPAQPKPAQPAAGAWQKLGERQINFKTERDVIPVTIAEGRFTKIKLKTRGGAVHFTDLKVHFGNGEVQDVQIRKNIPSGGETRVIDLPGGQRVIKKVSFVYRTKTQGRLKRLVKGKAHVMLWGRH